MDFSLSEEQQAMRDMAKIFGEEDCSDNGGG